MSLLALFLAPLASPVLQEPVDAMAVMKIREEGLENSEIMDTLWWLTDRYGPRLTNSPQERRALAWAKDRLTQHGLENARLEAWGEFGLGWSFEKCTVEMTAPIYMPIIATPKAWTLGLTAPISGEPILVEAETVADLEKYKGKLAGRIVLRGTVRDVPSPFDPLAERHDEEDLKELFEVNEPPPPEAGDRNSRRADSARRREVSEKLRAMMKEEGAACVLETDGGARKDYGVIMLGGGGSRDAKEERALPQIVIATEHWNRIARLLQKGEKVELAVDVKTTFYDDDLQGYNVLAEIPGSDLADEVVMLGGHFDSWHPATGTTDNGIGSAVAMEAGRILVASGLKPRRTIRLGLWTGEEQGLLGSKGFASKHFGDSKTQEFTPEHALLAAYFNLDNGGGRIRGIYSQGNAACRPIFEAWLEPFHDLGATTVTIKDTGGTDHLSFDSFGLPGFQFIQDPMDYSTRSHHTNMDTYERIHPTDARQAAVIMASFAYHAAMRDEKLPRKPLPKPEPKPTESAPGAAVEAATPRGSG
jgi:carboxypeptidase Q